MKKFAIAFVVIGGGVILVRGIGKMISSALKEGVKVAAEESVVKVLDNKD